MNPAEELIITTNGFVKCSSLCGYKRNVLYIKDYKWTGSEPYNKHMHVDQQTDHTMEKKCIDKELSKLIGTCMTTEILTCSVSLSAICTSSSSSTISASSSYVITHTTNNVIHTIFMPLQTKHLWTESDRCKKWLVLNVTDMHIVLQGQAIWAQFYSRRQLMYSHQQV